MADNKDKIKKEIFETSVIVQDAFRSISDNISEIFKDSLGVTATYARDIKKDITKSLSSLAQVTTLLEGNQNKILKGELSKRDILKQIEQRESKIQAINVSIEIAKKNQLGKTRDLTLQLQKALEAEKDIKNELNKQAEQAENVNKTIGTTGALLKGIGKIPIIGNLIDTKTALEEAANVASAGGSKFAAMGAALKSVGGDILKNITDPLTIAIALGKLFWDTLVKADKETAQLAKGFDISYTNASKLRQELAKTANSSGDTFVNVRALQESLLAIGNSLGTNAKLNEKDLTTFTKLREEAGFTNEELVEMEKSTLSMGGTLESNTKQFLGTVSAVSAQNKLVLNGKQLLKETLNVSAAIKVSMGGVGTKLAEAVVTAKKFGLTLEQADKISQGLLNFEASIASELEAELLTGKDLNLEEARRLALNNDIAGAAAEVAKQVGSSAEFAGMNRIQQEAIANSIGLSRDELAKSLIEREALQKIGAADAEQAKKKYDILRQTMTAEQAAVALGDEAYAKQLEQTGNAEKMASIIEKIKETFIPIAQDLLPKISEAFKWLGDHINAIKTTLGIIATIVGVQLVAGLTTAIAKTTILLAKSIATAAAWAIANPIQAAAGLIVAGGVGAVVYSQMQDGEIDSKGGLVVSGEKGTYKLDPNDHVIAGTELGKNRGGGSNSSNAMIDEFRSMRSEISKLGSRPLNVSIQVDGKEIAKAVGQSTSEYGTSSSTNAYRVQ